MPISMTPPRRICVRPVKQALTRGRGVWDAPAVVGEQNIDTVKGLWRAFSRGGIDSVLQIVDEDVEWKPYGGGTLPGRRRAGGPHQLGERLLERAPDEVEVRHGVVVAEQAEVDLAVVAHDRYRHRVVLGQERDRHELLHLAPEQVERELRPRH